MNFKQLGKLYSMLQVHLNYNSHLFKVEENPNYIYS